MKTNLKFAIVIAPSQFTLQSEPCTFTWVKVLANQLLPFFSCVFTIHFCSIMKKSDFSLKHCEHFVDFKSGNYISFLYAENTFFGICDGFHHNAIAMDFKKEFPQFWEVLKEIKEKIRRFESCANFEKFLFDDEIKIMFDFDGNKEKCFKFSVTRNGCSSIILHCVNYDNYDTLLCKILNVFQYGFMPHPSKKLLVAALIKNVSTYVRNLDEMTLELNKLSDLKTISHLGDSKLVGSLKIFLFNNVKNIIMIAKMMHEIGSEDIQYSKDTRKKKKICINEVIDDEIKKMN